MMISVWHLLWIVPVAASVGAVLMGCCCVAEER